jgi:hypothetical protein
MTPLLDSYSNLHAAGHYNGRNITYLFNIKSITVKSLNYKAACFKRNCCDDGVHGLTLITKTSLWRLVPAFKIKSSLTSQQLQIIGFVQYVTLNVDYYTNINLTHLSHRPICFYTIYFRIFHTGNITCKFICWQNLCISVISSAVQLVWRKVVPLSELSVYNPDIAIKPQLMDHLKYLQ